MSEELLFSWSPNVTSLTMVMFLAGSPSLFNKLLFLMISYSYAFYLLESVIFDFKLLRKFRLPWPSDILPLRNELIFYLVLLNILSLCKVLFDSIGISRDANFYNVLLDNAGWKSSSITLFSSSFTDDSLSTLSFS